MASEESAQSSRAVLSVTEGTAHAYLANDAFIGDWKY